MYVPKYFSLEECFPPELVSRWGNKAWAAFDARILVTADHLRRVFGPMYVNVRGLTQCGYRTRGTDGKPLSDFSRTQHRFGRALDLHPMQISTQDLRREIWHSPRMPWNEHITFMETDISWLHIDCRNTTPTNHRLVLWSPVRGYVRPDKGDAIDIDY